MKKWFIILLSTLLIVGFSISISAIEDTKTKYFGVGATVEEVEQATFMVKTNGEKSGEGFVFTPEGIPSGEKSLFRVSLYGKGTVYLKVVETDAKGKYIKEQKTPMILLTDDWKEFKLATKLHEKTSQVDLFVLTDDAQQTVFQFRDISIDYPAK